MSSCAEAQNNFSLYLYGELSFAEEEALETHLAGCPLCKLRWEREKLWHAGASASTPELSPQFLNQCRAELKDSLRTTTPAPSWASRLESFVRQNLRQWWTPRSAQWAVASGLLLVGFSLGRTSSTWRALPGLPSSQMSLMGDGTLRIRGIQPQEGRRVRLILDRVQESSLEGQVDDGSIQRLLIRAMTSSADPVLRVDSVALLQDQRGTDVRDALLRAAVRDENAGVRLRALQSLRAFATEQDVRSTLVGILAEDREPALRAQAIDLLVPPQEPVLLTRDLLPVLDTLSRMQAESAADLYLQARSQQILEAVQSSGAH